MEERTNRSNTMLLTVIAIATLLVAVIGATFAYFTARITGDVETASTVRVNGATLTVEFTGDSNRVDSASGFIPTKPNNNGTYAPVATKSFSLTGNNNTADMKAPYTLYLVVETNTFQLQNTDGYKVDGTAQATTSLAYKLGVTGVENGSQGVTQTTYANIKPTAVGTGYNPGTNDEALYATAFTNSDDATITNNAGTESTIHNAILLGSGYFKAGATDEVHAYTLDIYFNESGKNQDFDKEKTFTAYVVVDATAIQS